VCVTFFYFWPAGLHSDIWMGCIYVNDLEHIEPTLKVTLTERAKFQFTKFTYFCPRAQKQAATRTLIFMAI